MTETRHSACSGKLIVSGEHSVVAGAPAIAIPLPLKVHVTATGLPEPRVRLTLQDDLCGVWTVQEVTQRAQSVEKRYQHYRKGLLAVHAVAPDPADLLLTAVARADVECGWQIDLTSELPLGSGLGSSAACLCALLKVLRPEWTTEQLYQTARDCEHYQHGTSSGLDVAVSLSTGPLWVEKDSRLPLTLGSLPAWRLYHSGRPESSTGECVATVQNHFPADHAIWKEFALVTHETRDALVATDAEAWKAAIRRNHSLLTRLGVVPKAIQETISMIESEGGAAKICGAGSLKGDQAGAILCLGEDKAFLNHWHRLINS